MRIKNRFTLYDLSQRNLSDTEIRLILVVSPDCIFSSRPELPIILNDAMNHLDKFALDNGITFSSFAISLSQNSADGIRFLNKFGHFNEVSSGFGTLNSSQLYMKYIHGMFSTSVPRIIIAKRVYNTTEFDHASVHRLSIDEEIIISQFIGLPEIKKWQSDKFSLPIDML